MNINNAFPSKYLKSGDITDGDMVLTISHVEMENVGQGDDAEIKPIVYFEETEKGFVLNKTNAATIAKVVGTPETDGWAGKQIALFATEVDFQGKQTLALRVRMRPPAKMAVSSAIPPDQSPLDNTIDAIVARSQAMLDNPPAKLTPQQFDAIKVDWQQVWDTSIAKGVSVDAVPGSATPGVYLRAIVAGGKQIMDKQSEAIPF